MRRAAEGRRARSSLGILGALVLTASCGFERTAADDLPGVVADSPTRIALGPERNRAAKALSVSDGGADYTAGYDGSVKCAASLRALAQTLAASPLIGEDQARALAQAEADFATRARRLAAGEGKTARQASADLASASEAAADNRLEASRDAVGCIRGLAGEIQRSGR